MVGDPTGYAGPHPDIRQLVCDAINRLGERNATTSDRPQIPHATLDNLVVRCQRTWHSVSTVNESLNGANLTAVVVQVDDGDHFASFFIHAAQAADHQEWQPVMLSGGEHPRELADKSGGFTFVPASHVCVGGLLRSDQVASLRVEHADGSTYESPVVDNCAIVFAPVTSQPAADDEFVVSWMDQGGSEIESSRLRIGDRGPPPGVKTAET